MRLPTLASAFFASTTLAAYGAVNPADYIAISQTLASYPLAIDSKNFDALSDVFTSDVVANYSAPIGVLNGLDAVKVALNASLAPVTTQHALTTHKVTFNSSDLAQSVIYYTASHFGKGVYEGQLVTAWGKYEDELVKVGEGTWRVRRRNLVYMGPILGNLSIFGVS